jgi:hypothetical protein
MKKTQLSEKSYPLGNLAFKTIFILSAIFAGFVPLKCAQAQATVSVNIVSQPLWGPTGYDYVDYYYLPESGVYYNVPNGKFYYPVNGKWFYSTYLPATYHVDLYNTYKVVVYGPKPYKNHKIHAKKYGKYKTYRGKQLIIRDSPDKKYFVVKGHPKAAKVKATKPKSSKGNTIKPNNSKGKSIKPKGSNGNNSKPSGSKGNSSKGKGGKNN